MTLITVRTSQGEIRQLNLWGPPLRLHSTTNSTITMQLLLPTDLVCRVFSFLTPQDWLAADSTCRHWKQAATASLWRPGQRARVAAQEAAGRRIQGQWQRLYGFIRHAAALHGTALKSDLIALQSAVHPFELPDDFVASLELHDGQTTVRGSGLYGSFRLLCIREILHELSLKAKPPFRNNNIPNSLLLIQPLIQ